MSEKKPKITTKSSTHKNKEKNKSKKNNPISIVSLDQITPRTRKIIAKFVRDIIDEEKKNETINEKKSLSPLQTKIKSKINNKEDLQSKTPIKSKEGKQKEANKVINRKNLSNSAQKIKSKNNAVNYFNKKNNINININVNNGRFNKTKTSTSTANTMVNPHISYDNLDKREKKEKKEKKDIKKSMKTENYFKSPSNKETIGQKLIKEEIAQEKKTTVEKLKIIKMHILSLKKKEEELANKLIKLNNQESMLSKKDKDNEEKEQNLEKEEKIEKSQKEEKVEKEEKIEKNEEKKEKEEEKNIPDQKEKQNKSESDKKEINNVENGEKKEEEISKGKNLNNEKVKKEVKPSDKKGIRNKNVKNSKKNSLTKEKENSIKTKSKVQSAKILLVPTKNVKLKIHKGKTPEKRSKNIGSQNARISSGTRTNKKTKK